MSPRRPYPRFERCSSGQPGSLVYRVDGTFQGIVARIDREYHGSRPVFKVRLQGVPAGNYGDLRSAKALIVDDWKRRQPNRANTAHHGGET